VDCSCKMRLILCADLCICFAHTQCAQEAVSVFIPTACAAAATRHTYASMRSVHADCFQGVRRCEPVNCTHFVVVGKHLSASRQ
jgi:hypothetical protein